MCGGMFLGDTRIQDIFKIAECRMRIAESESRNLKYELCNLHSEFPAYHQAGAFRIPNLRGVRRENESRAEDSNSHCQTWLGWT